MFFFLKKEELMDGDQSFGHVNIISPYRITFRFPSWIASRSLRASNRINQTMVV